MRENVLFVLLICNSLFTWIAVRSFRTGDRSCHAVVGLLLWPQIHVQSASVVLLRETVVHHSARREVLQFPEQVCLPGLRIFYQIVITFVSVNF